MAEREEGLWMSTKERDRLKVLHEVKKRHITQKQAGAELGLSERWIRELLVRVRRRGDEGLGHGLRGRPSNRKTPEKVKRRVVELFREKKQAKLWHDYGPTLAVEELAADYGIVISRESLRKWLIEAKLWRAKRSRVEQAHVWRPRRARYGELVQWDTSEHDWLEGRGEKMYLIAMIDDATSELTARFVRHDSSEENLRQLRFYVERHGRPVAVYARPAGKGIAQSRGEGLGNGERVSGASFSAPVEPALSLRATTRRGCPPCGGGGHESGFGIQLSGEPYRRRGLHGALGGGDLSRETRAHCCRHARRSRAAGAAVGRKPMAALAKPSRGPGSLRASARSAGPASWPGSGNLGEIAARESAGQAATTRWPPPLVGDLRAITPSTDLASR